MRFYSRVADPFFVPYLIIFKRRLIALYQQGVRWYHKHIITDTFWVEMRINGDALYVGVFGVGQMYFEFQTTGYPVIPNGSFIGFNIPLAAAIGVTVNARAGQLTLKSEYMGGKRVADTFDTSLIKRSQQVQVLDEPVHYPGPQSAGTQGYPRALYESWAPGNPYTGMAKHAYHASTMAWLYLALHPSYPPHATRDVSFDVPYSDGNKTDPVRYAYVRDNGDWPRAMGVRTVDPGPTSTLDPREFAIYVDAFDQVCVFPTGSIGPLAGSDMSGDPLQNVPTAVVQFMRVPFPAWVYAKTGKFEDDWAINQPDTGLTRFPEYDWKLHPDGKRMCAVVFERSTATFDSAYYAPFATTVPGVSGPSSFFPTSSDFDDFNAMATGIDPKLGQIDVDNGATRYLYATGLLEVEITIELTGPNPEDYTLDLTVTEVRRPTTTQYCTLLAGYVWHDVKNKSYTKDNPLYDARRGDLCVLDVEHYGRNSDGARAHQLALKNLDDSSVTLRTLNVALVNVPVDGGPWFQALGTILAADFQTLSFALKRLAVTEPSISTTQLKDYVHLGVSIYVMNKYKRTIYPESISADAQAAIERQVTFDDEDQIFQNFADTLSLLPLNDLRDWTDSDMASLRETYTRDGTAPFPPYAGPPVLSYFNTDFTLHGHKYWSTTRSTPATSADVMTWFTLTNTMTLTAFPMFDLTDPRPGWYHYMEELLHRIQIHPYTTFFAHPNGSFAFFNQEFIYNQNGIVLDKPNFVARTTPDGLAGLDTGKLEHCIFDWVHFEMPEGKQTLKKETSFLDLYNLAIARANDDEKNFDNASAIENYDVLRASFSLDTRADTREPTITYDRLNIDWQGYTALYIDRSYFSGTKTDTGSAGDWEWIAGGGLQDLSLGAYWWKDSAETVLAIPLTENMPVTFSSCVLITK